MHTLFFKKYFFINNFDANLIKCQDNNTSIVYRNYDKKNYLNDIFKLKRICKRYKYKLILANDVKLAIKLGLDGAYLPSFNNEFHHLSYSLKKDFILLGSAHNLKEIKIKEKQMVDLIFLSPIFKTEKKSDCLGIIKFNNLSNFSKKPIIALGGLNNKNCKKLKMTNIIGIAGISHIKKIEF